MSMPIEPNGQWLFEFDRPQIQLLTPDEIYDRADEPLLRALQEDCRIEFKPNGIHPKDLSQWFSMWANTSPSGGLIVVGIRDDHHVEGCSQISQKQLNRLELTADDYCPDASYKVKRIKINRDGDGFADFILVFRVYYNATRVVRTVSGEVIVRRANRRKELTTQDQIRQLQAEKGEVRFEDEPCDQLKYPKDFNTELLAEFVSAVRTKKGWSDEHSMEDVLELMHLGVRGTSPSGFKPNIACALLFSIDPTKVVAGCRIRFLRFEGEEEGVGERWNAVKEDFIDGTIPQQIEQIAAILRSQLRTFSRLDEGRFFTAKEYPEFAWYEAIVNACAHRSYGNGMRNTPVFVKMFDDRLVVESPGAFPPFVDPDNFLHVPRNPFLMYALYHLRFVKCAHEGTRRMRAEMLESELPAPEWKQEQINHAMVRVTLRNNVKQRRKWVDQDVAKLLGTRLASSLTEVEKRCINFAAENGHINVTDAVRLTGHNWGTMKKILVSLVDKGIFDHIHAKVERDRSAHFVIRGPQPKQG